MGTDPNNRQGSEDLEVRGRHVPAPTREGRRDCFLSGIPRGRSVVFFQFLPGGSVFWDFGSLHRKPRVPYIAIPFVVGSVRDCWFRTSRRVQRFTRCRGSRFFFRVASLEGVRNRPEMRPKRKFTNPKPAVIRRSLYDRYPCRAALLDVLGLWISASETMRRRAPPVPRGDNTGGASSSTSTGFERREALWSVCEMADPVTTLRRHPSLLLRQRH